MSPIYDSDSDGSMPSLEDVSPRNCNVPTKTQATSTAANPDTDGDGNDSLPVLSAGTSSLPSPEGLKPSADAASMSTKNNSNTTPTSPAKKSEGRAVGTAAASASTFSAEKPAVPIPAAKPFAFAANDKAPAATGSSFSSSPSQFHFGNTTGDEESPFQFASSSVDASASTGGTGTSNPFGSFATSTATPSPLTTQAANNGGRKKRGAEKKKTWSQASASAAPLPLPVAGSGELTDGGALASSPERKNPFDGLMTTGASAKASVVAAAPNGTHTSFVFGAKTDSIDQGESSVKTGRDTMADEGEKKNSAVADAAGIAATAEGGSRNYISRPKGNTESTCACSSFCRCPSCQGLVLHVPDEPAGDAFVNDGEVPRQLNGAPRRILRAKRPPNAPSATSNAAGTVSIHAASSTNTATGRSSRRSDPAAYSTPMFHTSGNLTTRSRTNAPSSSGNLAEVAAATSADAGVATEVTTGDRTSNTDDDDEGRYDNSDFPLPDRTPSDPNANRFDALVEDGSDSDDGDESSDDYDDDESEDDNVVSDDNVDDSDDDSDDFNPFRDIVNRVMDDLQQRMERPSPSRPNSNIRPDEYNSDESSDDDEDMERPKCAACFRSDKPGHKWRRLVILPCCGSEGKEFSSSTRFCAACVLKMVLAKGESQDNGEYRPWEEERDEAPVHRFYKQNRQSDSKRFLECPRCRDIIIIKLKGLKADVAADSDDDSNDCDCSECRAERAVRASKKKASTASSISLHRATFKAKAWFVGRKRYMAALMWRAAHLHCNFIPLEALGGDKFKTEIMKLASWGILRKKPGKRNKNIFFIERKNQAEIIKLVSPSPNNETEKELEKEFELLIELSYYMIKAAQDCLRQEYRVDRALRLLNRSAFLLLYFKRFVPAPPLQIWQEWVITTLNVFSLTLLLQFLVVLVVYAGLFFGVGFAVCYGLKSGKPKSVWWQAILVGYFAFRVSKAVYDSESITWIGLVAPKAFLSLKKIAWG